MTLASEILARRMRLPRAETRDVVCERDLAIAMDDGAVLPADRYVAQAARDRPQPTVLVRSPYGRRQVFGLISGGCWPSAACRSSSRACVAPSAPRVRPARSTSAPTGWRGLRWIREQPWHADRIGMIGASYLGLVQWPVAPEAGDDLAALAIQVSGSQQGSAMRSTPPPPAGTRRRPQRQQRGPGAGGRRDRRVIGPRPGATYGWGQRNTRQLSQHLAIAGR